MASPPPPDPYLALGVPKDATGAAIKSQYRKLVLKFHPDKVQDEAQKQIAADQFHKIQTAYEIVGSEDKRARYDAQCKLAELRRDVMEQAGAGRGAEVRTAAFKVPTESRGGAAAFYSTRGPDRMEKVSPVYEERRPAYADVHATDYFDQPRAGARKDAEYERTSKRNSPRDEKERLRTAAKPSKETERLRQRERSKKTEKDIRKDRERKTAYIEDESDSDDFELRRARDAYHAGARREKDAAVRGYHDDDELARKVYSRYDDARDYIDKSRGRQRSEPAERRPSPVRVPSSKDKVEYIKRSEGRPSVMVRRGSGRPKAAGRETEERRPDEREPVRRSSLDVEEPRRPATLSQSKSSPAEIRMPYEKPRSQSVQIEKDEDFIAPKFKRAETMPTQPTSRDRRKDTAPIKGSSLRQTEIVDGLTTPGLTPEWTGPSPASKYRYQQEYADDHEYPTPDGYRTEVREPAGGPKAKYTRSPSPVRERGSEKTRAASSRYPASSAPRPAPPRTTSTSYVYTPAGVEPYSRPALSRDNSARAETMLPYEVPSSRSPRASYSQYSPPPEEVRYQKEIRPENIRVQSRPENIRVQSGFDARRPRTGNRPTYHRSGSGNSSAIYVK